MGQVVKPIEIEASIGSPPEHEGLIVELFEKAGDGQLWGELYFQDKRPVLTVYKRLNGRPWSFDCHDLLDKLQAACSELEAQQEPY